MEIGVVGLATHVGLDPAKEPHDFSRGSMSVGIISPLSNLSSICFNLIVYSCNTLADTFSSFNCLI